jgi:hypothetical protein
MRSTNRSPVKPRSKPRLLLLSQQQPLQRLPIPPPLWLADTEAGTLQAAHCQADNFAYIGRDFTVEKTEDFDPTYMRALFEYGRAQIKDGTAWKKSGPFLIPGQLQAGERGE